MREYSIIFTKIFLLSIGVVAICYFLYAPFTVTGEEKTISLSVDVNSYITFKAKPEKIAPSVEDYSSLVIIEIKNVGSNDLLYSQIFDTDTDGAHLTPEILNGFSLGNYDIYAKGYSHLTKKKANVEILSGINFIDFSNNDTEFLLAGDVNVINPIDPWQRGDDLVNAIDLAIQIEKLDSSLLIEKEDINKDGVVNSVDLGAVIENLDKTGEGA